MFRDRFKWYLKRLYAMRVDEIIHRLRIKAFDIKLQNKKKFGISRPLLNPELYKKWPVVVQDRKKTEKLINEAEAILNGHYLLLNLDYFEEPLDWHYDQASGIHAPLVFGIDYKDCAAVGNAKNIWEKNRCHHLSLLASAYAITHDKRYISEIENQLIDWVKNNPIPFGINWVSPLEMGIRLIAWVWIERLICGAVVHEHLFGQEGILWPSIYWQSQIIFKKRSFGSSANNHLVGEMAGLYLAASAWPVFPESKIWKSFSRKVLESEIEKQTFMSGLNREQAFRYHIFSLELFLLPALEAHYSGDAFPQNYLTQLKKMMEAIPPLLDVGWNLPRYGDGDEGRALQLDASSTSRLAWLFRIGRSFLNADVPVTDQDSLQAEIIYPESNNLFERPLTFSEGKLYGDAGVFVLASGRGTGQEVFCIADAGPQGYLSIAAHGHADALSFTLNVAGQEILVDPGTYNYHYAPKERLYLRSAEAHNTLTVNGCDQSESAGLFMWLRKARCCVHQAELTEDGGIIDAEHNGYENLAQMVVHRRKVALSGNKLEVADWLNGAGTIHVDWRLHFHPEVELVLAAQTLVMSRGEIKVQMELDNRLDWRLEEDIFSPEFNRLIWSKRLVGSFDAILPAKIEHCLEVL